MADLHSSTQYQNVVSGPFGYPKIKVPHDAAMGPDDPIAFLIHTSKGDVYVGGYNFWRCVGSADALIAAGFIRPDWLPGLPGNNKSRQTVAFEENGPRLLFGNRRGTKLDSPHIVVQRISARSYAVIVPPSSDQEQFLQDARERYWQRRNDELQLERTRKAEAERTAHALEWKATPASEVRQECTSYVRSMRSLIFGRFELSSFQPGAQMTQDLEGIFANLRQCLLHGVLKNEFVSQGNVVPFTRGR